MSNRPAPSPTDPDPPTPAAPDLTLSKVLAGAGAAVTAAVLGSFFGTGGTITGAALGSVASTIATAVYQRSLDRTQQTIAARLHPPRDPAGEDAGRDATPPDGAGQETGAADAADPAASDDPGATDPAATEPAATDPAAAELNPAEPNAADPDAGASPAQAPVVPAPPPADDRVVLRPPAGPAPRRNRWGVWLGVTALVFVIGLLAVTGIEWVKGSTLSTGQPGTSVGRILEPSIGSDTTTEPTSDPASSDSSGDSSGDPTADRSSHRSSTADASATSEPSPDPASVTTEPAPTSSRPTSSSSPASGVSAVPTTAAARGR